MGMKLLLVLMVLLVGFTTRVDAMPTLVVTESRYEANGDIRYFVTVSGWLATDNTGTVCGGEWDFFSGYARLSCWPLVSRHQKQW